MYKSSLHEKYGYYEHGDFPEDYEMWLRWLNAGLKAVKIPDYLFKWYDSSSRLTRTDSRYDLDAFYKVKSFYLKQEILKNFADKPIWIWGAGRISRTRALMLEQEGIKIAGFIDVKERDPGNKPCVLHSDFDWNSDVLILSYVANRGARQNIADFLCKHGKRAMKHYILVA